ncbi:MAG: UDP-2,3-diacylglucosamine diphosphatase [Salibacteraceae bacterium]
MKTPKRKVELVVLSDIHLGTYGCHAKELLQYIKSIDPQTVVLNGDIIDIWQFNKRYWPKSHMRVIKHFMGWVAAGKKVYYITGNHDEMLRKFVGFKMGSLEVVNKVVLPVNNRKAWFFHGDVFDVTMQHSKWLAHLGAVGYDTLIILNRLVNWGSEKMGKGKISLSKRIKNGVKSAVNFINNFEQTAAGIAIDNGYDYVVCGHIHQPIMKNISNTKGSTCYLNSGDWVENLTALEFEKGAWTVYAYEDDSVMRSLRFDHGPDDNPIHNNSVLFEVLVNEFKLMAS